MIALILSQFDIVADLRVKDFDLLLKQCVDTLKCNLLLSSLDFSDNCIRVKVIFKPKSNFLLKLNLFLLQIGKWFAKYNINKVLLRDWALPQFSLQLTLVETRLQLPNNFVNQLVNALGHCACLSEKLELSHFTVSQLSPYFCHIVKVDFIKFPQKWAPLCCVVPNQKRIIDYIESKFNLQVLGLTNKQIRFK